MMSVKIIGLWCLTGSTGRTPYRVGRRGRILLSSLLQDARIVLATNDMS